MSLIQDFPLEQNDRKQRLQENWYSKMPCKDCNIKEVCKYYNTIRPTDFNSDIFEIKIICKLKGKFIEDRLVTEELESY